MIKKIISKAKVKNLISYMLILLSIAWFYWIISKDLGGNLEKLYPDSYSWLAAAIILGILSQMTNSINLILLLRKEISKKNFLDTSFVFFTSQIIRHLPGRVWGIVYQVYQKTENEKKGNIINANVELMFVSFSGVISFSISFVIYHSYGETSSSLFLSLCILFIWIVIDNKVIPRFFQKMSYIPSINSINIEESIKADILTPKTSLIIMNFIIGWLIYLTAWITLAKAGYGDSAYQMILLASFYSLSWFIGYITLISPSGIGIREASFLLLAADIAPGSELLTLALLVRLWLLLIDLSLFLIFLCIKILYKNHTTQNKVYQKP